MANIIISSQYHLLKHMHPHVRISPFIPTEWDKILNTSNSKQSSKTLAPSFWLNNGQEINYFNSGRTALLACLKHLNLKSKDEVYIETTTGGKYISSCVTSTIEKVCTWSQVMSIRTKLILVIHEFGFPFSTQKLIKLKAMNLPILEDCAYAMGTRHEKGPVGQIGDYALYSLPKYLPIPFGGILASKKKISPNGKKYTVSPKDQLILTNTIQGSYPHLKNWNKSRKENWKFFSKHLKQFKCKPYFNLNSQSVPGAYICQIPKKSPGKKIKYNLNHSGVESTQFYHMGGFYFPIHQFLTPFEKNYILLNFTKYFRQDKDK